MLERDTTAASGHTGRAAGGAPWLPSGFSLLSPSLQLPPSLSVSCLTSTARTNSSPSLSPSVVLIPSSGATRGQALTAGANSLLARSPPSTHKGGDGDQRHVFSRLLQKTSHAQRHRPALHRRPSPPVRSHRLATCLAPCLRPGVSLSSPARRRGAGFPSLRRRDPSSARPSSSLLLLLLLRSPSGSLESCSDQCSPHVQPSFRPGSCLVRAPGDTCCIRPP